MAIESRQVFVYWEGWFTVIVQKWLYCHYPRHIITCIISIHKEVLFTPNNTNIDSVDLNYVVKHKLLLFISPSYKTEILIWFYGQVVFRRVTSDSYFIC